jgi:hypothetical protein
VSRCAMTAAETGRKKRAGWSQLVSSQSREICREGSSEQEVDGGRMRKGRRREKYLGDAAIKASR